MKHNHLLYIAPAIKVMAAATEPLLDLSVNADGEPIGQDPNPGTGDDQASNRGLFDEEERQLQRSIWDE